jgi:hypothetical protein
MQSEEFKSRLLPLQAIACYEAGQYYEPHRFEYLVRGHYPSLQELNKVNENGKIYDLGYLLIDFIRNTWGKKAVINIIKQNGDIQRALSLSEAEFETQFYAYLIKEYPQLNQD